MRDDTTSAFRESNWVGAASVFKVDVCATRVDTSDLASVTFAAKRAADERLANVGCEILRGTVSSNVALAEDALPTLEALTSAALEAIRVNVGCEMLGA